MKRITIIGYKKGNDFVKYRGPLEYDVVEFADGKYLVEPGIGFSMGAYGIMAFEKNGKWLVPVTTHELIEGENK